MNELNKKYKSGKAGSLSQLKENSFHVPDFFVCNKGWTMEDIKGKIDSNFPNTQYFAVRSSADNEDSKEKSFAGHFYSGIGITKENIFDEFKKVLNSFGENSGEVIVQKFIGSDSSGVLFVTKDKVIINSTIGLCRTVVNGYGCDEFVCDTKGSIISKKILKTKQIEVFENGKILSKEIQDKNSLDEFQIKELIKVSYKIRKFFDCDQDIEWCFLDGVLFILQSRPITTELPVMNLNYFDSANIAESYSGVVLPLTCSFAKKVYERVYKDFLIKSGVPRKKIEKHSEIFENLLGFFYGRMYYNMNNWYLLAAFMPGYNLNKKNFELMITSNIKKDIITDIKPSFLLYVTYPFILVTKLLFFNFTTQYFKRTIKKEIRKFSCIDFNKLTREECMLLLGTLDKKMLSRWYITLENDFLVMTHLGILTKLIGKQNLPDTLVFKSKSTEQIANLCHLSNKIKEDADLWSAVLEGDQQRFNILIKANKPVDAVFQEYLLNFGGRFANELKLESIGIDEDLNKFFSVLKLYSNYNLKDEKSNKNSKEIKLPFLKKILFNFTIKQFKKNASIREEFRLLRSNVFALDRKIFRRIGQLLVNTKKIKNIDDIFYLYIEEIIDESKREGNFFEKVNERKKQYEEYENISVPSHFSTYNNAPPIPKLDVFDNRKLIQANPVSSGVVRGKVRIFKEFFMPEVIDFDIIVTSHTDPGWTSLIALSKGMIIENGGVLSHASIVARELGIPTVIGAEDIIKILKDYQVVELDGSTGLIKIIS